MSPERILVVQLRRIGDVVVTLPAVSSLRRAFPDARIDFLVEPPADQMARLCPHIDETLVYDGGEPFAWIRKIRARRYDWVIDFHANGRTLLLTALSGARVRAGFSGPLTRRLAYNHSIAAPPDVHIVRQKLALLESLGVRVVNSSWHIALPAAKREWAKEILARQAAPGRPWAGIAPASRRETRLWRSEGWSEISSRLVQGGWNVLFLSGPGEEPLIRSIMARMDNAGPGGCFVPPKTDLVELLALIGECAFLAAVDNGPKNMAVALGVPALTLYGPTNPLTVDPHGDPRVLALREEKLFCIGCGLNRCPYRHECMEHLSAEAVYSKLEELMRTLGAAQAAGAR